MGFSTCSSAGMARARRPGLRARRSRCRPASSWSPTSSRASAASAAWRRPSTWRAAARAGSSTPAWRNTSARTRTRCSAGSTRRRGGTPRSRPSPRSRERMSGVELDAALAAIADFADLKSPYTTGHSRGVAERAASAALRAGLGEPAAAELRRAGLMHDVGRLGVSNTIWDKPGALSESRDGARAHASLPDAAHVLPLAETRSPRRGRGRTPRAARRLGIPARARRRRPVAGGADPRRGRRLPGDDRAAAAPPRALARRRRAAAARGRKERPARSPTRSTPCSARPVTAFRAGARVRPG